MITGRGAAGFCAGTSSEMGVISFGGSFARACSLLLQGLPPEAQAWIVAADEYDAGQLRADGLRAIRQDASRVFTARFEQATVAERGALSAAMHRLWPELDPDGWHSTAWYFLHWCAGAGVEETTLVELLRRHFGPFLAGRGTSIQELVDAESEVRE